MRPTVLVLTHSGDHYVIERVLASLERRGARALRLDTDRFPAELRLSIATSRSGKAKATCADAEGEHDLSGVRAVWARKLWTPRLEGVDPRLREGCVRESRAALLAFLDAFHGARWVNAIAEGLAAENKELQQRVAGTLGLEVPRTLVTNDPTAVRALRAECGAIVAKMLTPLTTSMDGPELFVHTSLVRDEDLEHLDGLRHAPMVFQELVEKEIELRVACVGDRCFAGAIDARSSERGAVDWRRARPDEVRWTRAELPRELERKLAALLAELGLAYGAVDLIRTPDGRHVFLEINPAGEWGMLERDLELPIADAIAAELLREGTTP